MPACIKLIKLPRKGQRRGVTTVVGQKAVHGIATLDDVYKAHKVERLLERLLKMKVQIYQE